MSSGNGRERGPCWGVSVRAACQVPPVLVVIDLAYLFHPLLRPPFWCVGAECPRLAAHVMINDHWVRLDEPVLSHPCERDCLVWVIALARTAVTVTPCVTAIEGERSFRLTLSHLTSIHGVLHK